MNCVEVKLASTAYQILIGRGLWRMPEASGALRSALGGRRCLLITDTAVGSLYGEVAAALLERAGAAAVRRAAFPAGEVSKTLATVEGLYGDAVSGGLGRTDAVVALGGGVVGDVAGFVAATYMRGVSFVQLPTTLLAMVDSSVGGKVGVDLPAGKNLVGAFHQPALVLADLAALDSLPARELACGWAEIAKYGVIMDAGLFARLEGDAERLCAMADTAAVAAVVSRCCELKAQVVAEDEKETAGRAILNYGHTFGHALEVLCGYAGITHGEGVAVGMGMAADLAVAAGMAAPEVRQRQDALLARLHLPLRLAELGRFGLRPEAVLECMYRDKKARQGRLRLVLPQRLGSVVTVEFTDTAAVLAAIGGRLG